MLMQDIGELPVGKRVALHRKRRGLTQRELGALVDRTDEWVRQVESGRHTLDRLSVLRKLSAALDVDLTDLLD